MKLITTLATVALLWGGAVKANDFGSQIEQAFVAAGYTNIAVAHVHGDWLVSGDLAGVAQTFRVDHKTGVSTAVDANSVTVNDDNGTDGVGHDVGDDNGTDGAGHDVGDDHGADGATHDAGDDHGGSGHGGGESGGSDD